MLMYIIPPQWDIVKCKRLSNLSLTLILLNDIFVSVVYPVTVARCHGRREERPGEHKQEVNMNNTTVGVGGISKENTTGVSASVRELVLTALFTAIILMMAFVPNLGYINLVIIKATLLHIPVIIGAVLLGPKKGAFLGGVFGATSFINNTFNPSVMSFAFSPIVAYSTYGIGGVFKTIFICFVPRICIGIGAYFVYTGLRKIFTGKIGRSTTLAVAGVCGAMINTILVMGSIYVLYASAYAEATGIQVADVFKTVMGVVFGQGILEAIVSGIIVSAVGTALMVITKHDK